jgi:hypothetical protein
VTFEGLTRRRVLLTLVAVPFASACAPSTPDTDSWRLHARRAVADVLSSVQTSRLALEQALDGRLYDAYVQNLTLDAEEAGNASAGKLAAEQPPVPEHQRYTVVTDQLDQATGLLADARIAAVEGRTGEYPKLIQQLHSTAARLDTIEQDLYPPPRSRP